MRPIDWWKQPIDDIVHAVNERLKADGVEFGEYEFSKMTRHTQAEGELIPDCRWLVCYPVRGGSEGWYIHLAAVIDRKDRIREHRMLGMAKTWNEESAWRIARAAATHLDIV